MDKDSLLQSFEKKSSSLTDEFSAVGRSDNNYYFVLNGETKDAFLAIAGLGASFDDALKDGIIVPLAANTDLKTGHNRVLLIERSMAAGLPTEDAVRLTSAISNYTALEYQLGDSKPARK